MRILAISRLTLVVYQGLPCSAEHHRCHFWVSLPTSKKNKTEPFWTTPNKRKKQTKVHEAPHQLLNPSVFGLVLMPRPGLLNGRRPIGQEAIDLVTSMMRHDRHTRPTVREALHHSFFQKHSEKAREIFFGGGGGAVLFFGFCFLALGFVFWHFGFGFRFALGILGSDCYLFVYDILYDLHISCLRFQFWVFIWPFETQKNHLSPHSSLPLSAVGGCGGSAKAEPQLLPRLGPSDGGEREDAGATQVAADFTGFTQEVYWLTSLKKTKKAVYYIHCLKSIEVEIGKISSQVHLRTLKISEVF